MCDDIPLPGRIGRIAGLSLVLGEGQDEIVVVGDGKFGGAVKGFLEAMKDT
jgi:hypothetical protein